jgi:plastocyanin
VRTRGKKRFQSYVFSVLGLFVLFFAENNYAVTHVVMFGGALGFVFSPSSFSASVGDTVKWEGDFTVHPLSSTTIPAQAASWHNGTGTVFTYKIAVAGTYHYQCDVHFSIGMVGSFTASATEIKGDQTYLQQKSYPMNILVGPEQNIIQFIIPNDGKVTISLFDLNGREVSTILSRYLNAGSHQTAFGPLPAGLYCLRLYSQGQTLVRSIHIIR